MWNSVDFNGDGDVSIRLRPTYKVPVLTTLMAPITGLILLLVVSIQQIDPKPLIDPSVQPLRY